MLQKSLHEWIWVVVNDEHEALLCRQHSLMFWMNAPVLFTHCLRCLSRTACPARFPHRKTHCGCVCIYAVLMMQPISQLVHLDGWVCHGDAGKSIFGDGGECWQDFFLFSLLPFLHSSRARSILLVRLLNHLEGLLWKRRKDTMVT